MVSEFRVRQTASISHEFSEFFSWENPILDTICGVISLSYNLCLYMIKIHWQLASISKYFTLCIIIDFLFYFVLPWLIGKIANKTTLRVTSLIYSTNWTCHNVKCEVE